MKQLPMLLPLLAVGVPRLLLCQSVDPDLRRVDWKSPAMSLVIPGAGQILSGRERGAVYFVAEIFLLTRLISERDEATRERARYRSLALNVARRAFAGIETDTVFEYYDKVGKFVESGPFTIAADGSLVPPTDPGTFNGSIWLLARRTFLSDPDDPDVNSPEYQRALEFYSRRAIGENFRWSWRNAALERDLYRRSIRKSDDAFRRASAQMGALLANHILSAVDAFVSYRLTNGRALLRTTLIPAGMTRVGTGTVFNFVVTVGF